MSSPGAASGKKITTPAKVIVMPTPRPVRQRRMVRRLMALLAIALVLAAARRWYIDRFFPQSPEQLGGISLAEAKITELINQERQKHGLSTLATDARLMVIARSHSYDMALRNYVGHVTPDGIGPAQRAHGEGIPFDLIGENVYEDSFRDRSALPERAVKGWMNSPHHREIILSSEYRTAGVGVAYGADGKTYVTQDFVK